MTLTTTTAITFATSFGIVFFLVLQSLFTNNGKYMAAFINSALCINPCNYYILKHMPATTSPADDIAYLLGGPLACVAAMHAFAWYRKRVSK